MLVDAPIIAIEVLSATDSHGDLKMRAVDLERMGVHNIWLLDPKERTAEVWSSEAWQPVKQDRLYVTESHVYLDLPWLQAKLGQYSS